MAVTWDIAALNATKTVGSLSDVVTTVHWTASDSETVGSGDSAVVHGGSAYGSVGLAAYGSVTKENAVAWAKAALGSEHVTATETSIASQITESKTPTKTSGVPW